MNFQLAIKCMFGLLIITMLLVDTSVVFATNQQPINNDEQGNMVPFYWSLAVVGGIIAITLSYVSWRKYKGEKKNKQKEHNN